MPATSKPKLPYCGFPFTPACAVAGAEGTDSMPTPANALDASTTANFLIISTHSDDSAILRQGIQKRARRQSTIACLSPANGRVQRLARRRGCQRLRDQKRQTNEAPRYPRTAPAVAIVRTPTAMGPEAWWTQKSKRLSSLEKRSAAAGFTSVASWWSSHDPMR